MLWTSPFPSDLDFRHAGDAFVRSLFLLPTRVVSPECCSGSLQAWRFWHVSLHAISSSQQRHFDEVCDESAGKRWAEAKDPDHDHVTVLDRTARLITLLVGEDDSSPDSPGFSAFKGGILAYWCRFLTLKSYPKHHPYFSNKLIKSYWLERGGNLWQGKAGCGIEVGHGSTITFYRDICRCTSIQFSCPRSWFALAMSEA